VKIQGFLLYLFFFVSSGNSKTPERVLVKAKISPSDIKEGQEQQIYQLQG